MDEIFKVIILEDEEHNRRQLISLIESREDLSLIRVLEHGGGALDICKTELPDILLADIHVPYESGLKVARGAVQLGICCIFTTKVENYALEAYRMGATGYITKPYQDEAFHKAVDQALNIIRGRRSGETQPSCDLAGTLKSHYSLTPAETELAMAVMGGCIRENLPACLGKSDRAIKSLLQGIYRKTVSRESPFGGTGRSDKYGRLIYFLHELKRIL